MATMRRNIATHLLAHAGLIVKPDDVFSRDQQGYHVRDWISFRHPADGPAAPPTLPAPAVPMGGAPVAQNERQAWILTRIKGGASFTREEVERKFGVSDKTAKRDLGELIAAGQIEFVRAPAPGFYRKVS